MRVSEWVAVGYFGYLCATAIVRPAWPRRTRAAAASLIAALAVSSVRFAPDTAAFAVVRDWLPAVYLVVGYWLSGWYFVRPMQSVEVWLLALDRRLLGADPGGRLAGAAPRPLLEAMELAYALCFLFVPGGLLLLVLAGHPQAADRYWTLVLLSEFGSFAMLPWVQTRPPRLIEPSGAIDRRGLLMRRVNQMQVQTVSIGVNTFPSGHVAGSLATAIAVADVIPQHAPWLLAVVAAIAVAAVLGRYHYLADAVAGAGLTLVLWGLLRGLGL